ncbi:O-antigen translocase [Pseudomonas sp. RTC3]|uniref:O-antigen translocase n=1 Tax=unclassified Pseudomonas TaxID=196821 RepID=UPI002AB5387F|nr:MULTISPECIES: O-antigen translocase [unclassified Pseudomonas]MEB0064157.1 O-antigen translocase [Pseudomonas sp. RTC3]MDY7565986.1 O-antigen translocase [Pseudomonas sp. 5C2]MEB0007615.1 O-antigen translocase [Pseudomonas sp. RTB2]MEB0018842.1 O-antigen translocase [Pseudomonas sp. RTB3]MEB0239328.1 O-antigen translocase [Pseudomonas sp. 5C2]
MPHAAETGVVPSNPSRRIAIYSALLTSAAQGSKILVGFCVLKLVAMYLGPDGLGKLGHFMSVVSILVLLAGGGLSHGVIKYSSEYKANYFKFYKVLSTSIIYAGVFSLVFFVAGIIFSNAISKLVFGDVHLYWVILLLAASQIVFAFNVLFSSFANGLGDVKLFAKTQIIGNLMALPVAWLMISNYGVPGAAIAIVAVFFMAFFPGLSSYIKSPLFLRISWKKIDTGICKKLGRFGLMLVVSAIAFPLVEILIRESLIKNVGYKEAGIWQGSIKLSSAYLGFFSVFLASYFLPIISPMISKKEIGKHVFKFLLVVMFVFSLGGGVLYIGRSFFIPLLLSRDFVELESYLIYQLVGDFFKVSAYVIGFVSVAKAATKIYIGSEFIQAGIFLGLNFTLGHSIGGVAGVMVAYMYAYIIFFAVSLAAFMYWMRS